MTVAFLTTTGRLTIPEVARVSVWSGNVTVYFDGERDGKACRSWRLGDQVDVVVTS